MEPEFYQFMQGQSQYYPKPTYEDPAYTSNTFFTLDSPTGWLIYLSVYIFDLISGSFLSFITPFLLLLQDSHALPSFLLRRLLSLLRHTLLGFVGAISAATVLIILTVISVLIGVTIVRVWVDEPVEMQEVVYFDYTVNEPGAVMVLGGLRRRQIPAGHSVVVVLELILPESEYNRRLGMFQVTAEAISRNGKVQAASSRPFMLRFRSHPIRLLHTFLNCIPILLGLSTETQRLTIELLQYTEINPHRTHTISVKLKPRAGIGDLPQLYASEVKIRTQLPWMKRIVHDWKWTLCVWTTFYVYGFVLVLVGCYLRPSVFGLGSWLTGERRVEGEREGKEGSEREREERGERGELSERMRKWRERMEKRRRRIEHRRVSGELAASESSECI